MRKGMKSSQPVPKNLADGVFNANPATGVQNSILTEHFNPRILSIAAQVTWTVQPDPLEIHLILDDLTYRWFRSNPITATWYYAELEPTALIGGMPMSSTRPDIAFLIEGRKMTSLKFESTGGTTSNAKCYVHWAKW